MLGTVEKALSVHALYENPRTIGYGIACEQEVAGITMYDG